MTKKKGKIIIGSIWIIGFLILFSILSFQTIYGEVYKDKATEAWGWFMPHIVPTLGIILGVVLADYSKSTDKEKEVKVSSIAVLLGTVFSLAHIIILFGVIIMAGNAGNVEKAIATLSSANLPLGAIQGFVATILSFFFQSKGESENKPEPTGAVSPA